MRVPSLVPALIAIATSVQGAHLPRTTAAPQSENLAARGNPFESAICGVLAFCHKTATVTATATTTTTLAPSTVVVVSSTTTVMTVTSTATVTPSSCVSGVLGIYNGGSKQLVAYVSSTAPYTNTNGVTYDTGLKVSASWTPDGIPNHSVQTINQPQPHFGLKSPTVNGTTPTFDVIQDSSAFGTGPGVDSSGTAYESNVWQYLSINQYKAILSQWTDPSGHQQFYTTWWNPSTGQVVASINSPASGYIIVYLAIVTPDVPH